MAFKETKYLQTRRFLNSNRGIAALQCNVSRSMWSETPGYGYVDADISISDCHRSVTLDFNIGDKKEVVQKLAKIDALIADMVKFKTSLTKAANEYLKHKDNVAVKKKSTTNKPAVIKSKL